MNCLPARLSLDWAFNVRNANRQIERISVLIIEIVD
jgi:hypothetical protein